MARKPISTSLSATRHRRGPTWLRLFATISVHHMWQHPFSKHYIFPPIFKYVFHSKLFYSVNWYPSSRWLVSVAGSCHSAQDSSHQQFDLISPLTRSEPYMYTTSVMAQRYMEPWVNVNLCNNRCSPHVVASIFLKHPHPPPPRFSKYAFTIILPSEQACQCWRIMSLMHKIPSRESNWSSTRDGTEIRCMETWWVNVDVYGLSWRQKLSVFLGRTFFRVMGWDDSHDLWSDQEISVGIKKFGQLVSYW